jgi:hypothetical protein
MPSGNSIDCGDAAKGERFVGFFFTVSFVALAIGYSLVKYLFQKAFLSESPCYDGLVQTLGFAPR